MVVSVRNEEDLAEIWANLCKGMSVMLWCDGLKQTQLSQHPPVLVIKERDKYHLSLTSSVAVRKRTPDKVSIKKKEDQVAAIIADLRKRHSESYATMQ